VLFNYCIERYGKIMSLSSSPLVSVGVPVYNSESTLRDALESLLNQTYTNIQLVISDNFSTDATVSLCREYETKDKRVIFHQQKSNIGMTENFDFVLKNSTGDFFMWAAGDDVRSQNFIEVNLQHLLRDPNCVASTSPNIHEDQAHETKNFVTYSLEGTRTARFKSFFQLPGASHGIFYSLMRTSAIKACPFVSSKFFWGWDWAIILFLANLGSVHRSTEGLTIFGAGGVSRKGDVYKSFGINGIRRLIPFARFNKQVVELTANWSKKERAYVAYLLFSLSLKTLLKSNKISLAFFYGLKQLFKLTKAG
jgi:glycosyltransferase involved in cell wall biosynthesis